MFDSIFLRAVALMRLPSAVALAMLCVGCSSPQTSQQRLEAGEYAQLAPLKRNAPDVIQGFDIQKGTTLVVSVDSNALLSLDEDKEDQLKAATLASWHKVWTQAHPRAHAVLLVRMIDYHGTMQWQGTARV